MGAKVAQMAKMMAFWARKIHKNHKKIGEDSLIFHPPTVQILQDFNHLIMQKWVGCTFPLFVLCLSAFADSLITLSLGCQRGSGA
jgi:hypothetical protein